ncbi:MAG TPA: polyprenyl synthetase family protein [Rickettsiales bacterium]|nr:polyprenyl synthetase family protein [Rickettsiales bacterium]
MNLEQLIDNTKLIINQKLNDLIKDDDKNLTKAIKYSLLCNGKRLRSLLVMETAKLFSSTNEEDLITVACAVEMIHIFSLIHDDLPCMDNDDYRRGELTCHKKFNEYDALLAGDSLIPLCFETILTKTKILTSEEKCKIIEIISKAIGYKGMCLGQSLDMDFANNDKSKSSKEAEEINILKTGYLFEACIKIGCILGKANEKEEKNLIEYSLNFGKAFQLADDLKDSEINSNETQLVKDKIKLFVKNCINNLNELKKNINNLKIISEYCLKDL